MLPPTHCPRVPSAYVPNRRELEANVQQLIAAFQSTESALVGASPPVLPSGCSPPTLCSMYSGASDAYGLYP